MVYAPKILVSGGLLEINISLSSHNRNLIYGQKPISIVVKAEFRIFMQSR